jgi:hypothetical protein
MNMKVIIELPDNWLDTDLTGNIDWITKSVRQEVSRAVTDAVVKTVQIPEVKISKEELKVAVLKELVNRKVDDILTS